MFPGLPLAGQKTDFHLVLTTRMTTRRRRNRMRRTRRTRWTTRRTRTKEREGQCRAGGFLYIYTYISRER